MVPFHGQVVHSCGSAGISRQGITLTQVFLSSPSAPGVWVVFGSRPKCIELLDLLRVFNKKKAGRNLGKK